MKTVDQNMPECKCTAHPSGVDKRKGMRLVDENQDVWIFGCTICTEICHTAVIQVRSKPLNVERGKYLTREYKKARLVERTKQGRIKYFV